MLAPLLALALGAVSLEGTSPCPAPADVQARLAPLLPLAPTRERRALLRREGAELKIFLYDGATLLGERRLPARGPCRALADATAVILASWLSDLDAELAAPPPAPQEDAPPPSRPRLRLAPAEPGEQRAVTSFFGLALSLGPGGPSSTTVMGLSYAALEGGWGFCVGAQDFGRRELQETAVAPGIEGGPSYVLSDFTSLEWERYGVRGGPLYRWLWSGGGLTLDAQAELVVAALALRRDGSAGASSATLADVGGVLGFRVTAASGLWLGAHLVAWPLAPSRGLPVLEPQLGGGVGWGTP